MIDVVIIVLILSSIFLTVFTVAFTILSRAHLQNLPGKLGQQSSICWNSLGLFRDYGLNYIFLGIKLICFVRQKAETFSICLKKNFVKPHKVPTHSNNFYFHFLVFAVPIFSDGFAHLLKFCLDRGRGLLTGLQNQTID